MSKPEKFSVVGQKVSRFEGYEKVAGESRFIADIVVPGMLSGKILRSPYPHARIVNIDTSKAEKLRGVRALVTSEDTIKRGWGLFSPTNIRSQKENPATLVKKSPLWLPLIVTSLKRPWT